MPILLGIILIFGAILRWYALSEQSLWIDESFSMAIAQAIQDHNYPLVGSGDVIWRSPLYHYVLALVGSLSNWNMIAMRSLSVVSGLCMVWLGYAIGKNWLSSKQNGKTIGLLLSGLLAVTTIEIAWSRQIRMYILFQLCFWGCIYAYHLWRLKKIQGWFPIIGVVATLLAHELGVFVLVVIVQYELIRWLTKRQTLLGIDFSLHLLIITMPVFVSYLVGQYLFHFPIVNYWSQYGWYLITTYGVFLPLGSIGLGLLEQQSKLLARWLLAMIFTWLGLLSFVAPLLQYRYLFVILPALLLFVAIGGTWLWQKHWYGKVLLGCNLSLAIWLGTVTIIPQSHYWLESDTPTSSFSYKSITPQPDFQSAHEFLSDYLQVHPDVMVATPYPILYQYYLQQQPAGAVFVNLIGSTYQSPPVVERYSGLKYLTRTEVDQLSQQSEVIILLDDFARYRLDETWQDITLEPIWESNIHAWSKVVIYRILP